MAKHDLTKTPFSQNFSTDFSEILEADVKLMLGKVLKVSRPNLPPFLGYRENPAGGGRNPPPSGTRVKGILGCGMCKVFKCKELVCNVVPTSSTFGKYQAALD